MSFPTAARATRSRRGAREPTLSAPLRSRIETFIQSNLSRDLSLAVLAANVHLSPFHFARAFRNTFGHSPHQYVTRERVGKARQLLRSNGMLIGEVALAVGYSSHGQFSTVFRRITGTTPRQYRLRCGPSASREREARLRDLVAAVDSAAGRRLAGSDPGSVRNASLLRRPSRAR